MDKESDKEERMPLALIGDWWAGQAEPARSNLAFFVLVRARPCPEDWLLEIDASFAKWLAEELDCFQHIGRTLMVRALIDYIVADQASDEQFQQVEQNHLNLVDYGRLPKDARMLISGNLSKLPESQAAWVSLAASWETLRETRLSDHRLRLWENHMQARNPGS